MISTFGTQQEVQLLVLLVSGAVMLLLAGPLRIPYPILLVVGGLLLGFGPGVPKVTMPPEVVLVGILPPLLYVSAYFTGLRELRKNLRPISQLAIGLVIVTTAGVAVVAHWITDLSWEGAFILGLAHGLLWIGMSIACIIAARARVIPFWLAVTVAVLGGLGPFAGSIGFVVADRRNGQSVGMSTRYS